ncbi:MAG: AmmeMemoRadiSam system protein B, partial [Candidatus Omnitrophica bacterium]|nr:AmmeMemoRadiSam system protein B [Candidatus Omnitrophota bacterium]
SMHVRKPHVAGSFYPAAPRELREFFQNHFVHGVHPVTAKAVILPHAGYVFSGKTACRVVSRVDVPRRNFLIGPNHTGYGPEFSVVAEGEWQTPLGKVPIDADLAKTIVSSSRHLEVDIDAHRFEHCLEVEIPLLQARNPDIEIVPLVVGTSDLKLACEVAAACAAKLATEKEPVLLVISTDMSHYENEEATRKKDRYALDAIEALDEEALARSIREHRITMCGFVPVYMVLSMKKELGFKKATLVEYTTSAEASGDYSRVVGYAGFIIE